MQWSPTVLVLNIQMMGDHYDNDDGDDNVDDDDDDYDKDGTFLLSPAPW